jgi:hypothetical protein
MFTGLSKLADKSFVLGFFLPALIGTVAIIALNKDWEPASTLFKNWMNQQSFANLTVVLLIVWTLSVLLMAGSRWMYRVLEGYAWPLAQPFLKKLQLKRRKSQRVRVRKAYDAHLAAPPATASINGSEDKDREQNRLHEELRYQYSLLLRGLYLEYPEQRHLVLPTRFGNVLRAFEIYPGTVYGVESIHAWPRLLAVIPKDYQIILADARAPVDFFVSLVFVSFFVGTVSLIRSAVAVAGGTGALKAMEFGSAGVVAFVMCRFFYLAAVSSAITWGEIVKSAFDLYLPSLANAMGYALPETLEERRCFWDALASQFQFQKPIRPEKWPATASQPPEAKRSAKAPEESDMDDKDEDTDSADAAEADDRDGNRINAATSRSDA